MLPGATAGCRWFIELAVVPSSIEYRATVFYLLSIVRAVRGGVGGSGEGVMEMEEIQVEEEVPNYGQARTSVALGATIKIPRPMPTLLPLDLWEKWSTNLKKLFINCIFNIHLQGKNKHLLNMSSK